MSDDMFDSMDTRDTLDAPGAHSVDTLVSIDDLADWPARSYELLLTDGLPVHPPLRSTVDALVAATGRPPDDEVGPIPPRDGIATIDVIAANAAMAGALPEHMPVILAAMEAMLEDAFNLRGVQTTTHGCWPLVIVSGHAVTQLGMAHAESVFSGGGARANLAIGRAIRLALWNIGGALPGEPVKEVFGHPGRLAFCIAETPDAPWPPFRAGLNPSAVSVLACEAPHSVALWGAPDDPVARLDWPADALRTKGSNNTNTMGEALVCVSPSEARRLADAGLSREDVARHLHRLAQRPRVDLRPDGGAYPWWPGGEGPVPVAARPEDIHVVVTGGDSIPWYAVCPGWGHLGGFLQTRTLP